MLITLIALLAVAGDAPHIITPKERSIIEQAVKPELSSPGTLKIGPVPAAATIVCGRVNGMVFKVAIRRGETGQIVGAQQVSVMTPDSSAVRRSIINSMCLNQGYSVF